MHLSRVRISTRAASALALGACALSGTIAYSSSAGQIEWALGGEGFSNNRNQEDQTKLSPANASQLAVKWTATLHGDVSATPAVTGGVVYVPDWGVQVGGFPAAAPTGGGYLNAINESNGAIIWSKRLSDYPGETATAISRTSPAVVEGVIYIGDQGGNVLAINAKTGNLIWITNIDPTQPAGLALVTQSPMVSGDTVFVGTASNQENEAKNPYYSCCTHRGSFSALDATTGAILWTFFTEPPNSGPPADAGAGVWGSTAAVDRSSGIVYIATGNDYSTTTTAQACHEKAVADSNPAEECLDPGDYHDSIIALDIATGKAKWITGPQQLWDSWNDACVFTPGQGNCPNYSGPDYDFGSGPQLLEARDPNTGKKYKAIGIGEKSGKYWLLDATTGQVKWVTQVAAGATLGIGGIQWGSSTDGTQIYVSSTDNGLQGFGGRFTALDPATGKKNWDIADPNGTPHLGSTSVSNGVVFAGSMDGYMYAINAATGQILWSFKGAGASNAGPAIGLDGTVYWGNGYSHFVLGAGSTTFYAFSVNGK